MTKAELLRENARLKVQLTAARKQRENMLIYTEREVEAYKEQAREAERKLAGSNVIAYQDQR